MRVNNEQLMRDALSAINTLKSRVSELESYAAHLERLAGVPTSKSRVRGPLEGVIGEVLENAARQERKGSGTVGAAIDAEVTKRRTNQRAAADFIKRR
jgi:hypothetical protein